MGTSKNQRRAAVGGKGGFERSIASKRFIPTAGGQRTYILTPSGLTKHVVVGSEEFLSAVAELRDAEDRFVEAEIQANIEAFPGMGWDSAVEVEAAASDSE